MIATAFTGLVGCSAPIQQAPMGPVVTPQLSAAVARAGGVGSISVMPGLPKADLVALLDATTAGDPGVLAANFITEDLDLDSIREAAGRVRIIDFFWNTPRPEPVEVAHREGALVNWQVGSMEDARAAAAAGADLVTVQGMEAGGHVRGRSGLLPLLSAAVDELDVPVLAAGGISDPRSLAAVLAAGAAGARVGTRFIAASESGAHPQYVSALLDAGPGSTEITDAFAVCPLCATLPRARVLRSAIEAVDALWGADTGTMPTPEGEMTLPARFGMPPHRDVQGRIEAMALYAGQGVGSVTVVVPAADIVEELTTGAESLLCSWA